MLPTGLTTGITTRTTIASLWDYIWEYNSCKLGLQLGLQMPLWDYNCCQLGLQLGLQCAPLGLQLLPAGLTFGISTGLTNDTTVGLKTVGSWVFKRLCFPPNPLRPAHIIGSSHKYMLMQGYCENEAFDDGDTITDYKTIVYAEHLTNSATYIDDPSQKISFKTAEVISVTSCAIRIGCFFSTVAKP